ncbi:hypothetical protein KZ686_10495 [Cupriavidus cauae]|uniref:Transmembrane lipoprotein n=1 Tax=Cupriavidus cauae TaxID=2608999 RepID=A0A5M8AMR6_9BURK|nr:MULTISPECIES: hypothetical protein [Cupriavidus]KAA6125247.1 hypothetical protein F1599_10685 [Cupriavidus cauae]MCA7083283.1 hypothetical protein [Cupriavidus sp. DB3]UZN48255.1 hypothetical protein KZ686_10495 [Cupriavidus cauae]
MKAKSTRSEPRRASGARRRVAGALLALLLPSMLLHAASASAQSPGLGALLQGHGRHPGRGAEGYPGHARKDRERPPPRETRGRANRQRAEREAGERPGRGGKLSADERRKLRQSLYDISREMYQGN